MCHGRSLATNDRPYGFSAENTSAFKVICGEGGDLITLELTSKVGNEINIGVHFGK